MDRLNPHGQTASSMGAPTARIARLQHHDVDTYPCNTCTNTWRRRASELLAPVSGRDRRARVGVRHAEWRARLGMFTLRCWPPCWPPATSKPGVSDDHALLHCTALHIISFKVTFDRAPSGSQPLASWTSGAWRPQLQKRLSQLRFLKQFSACIRAA